eukprot:TRINITY_DN23057_c0_g1_i1.p1 TRINITY_DN23057_c0_g1~~TRINITY_DN23057_c0_g1_i1.p1  ORF type:complete len:383 (-),score=49.35 TRINITY_DN23057_c0_g1_i1:295-1443(-)
MTDPSADSTMRSSIPQGGVVLEFCLDEVGETSGRARSARTNATGTTVGKYDKPWRLSAKEVKAQREQIATILSQGNDVEDSAGVSLDEVRVALVLQDLLDFPNSAEGPHPSCQDSHVSLSELQFAATTLLQAATNARPQAEVRAARITVDETVEKAGLTLALAQRLARPSRSVARKLELLHEVLPRLWVGGWAALNNGCKALHERGVTDVVSVMSSDQRKLPGFIKGHLHVHSDDNEGAADKLAAQFENIAQFIDAALSVGGVVFVHCGAGISRAPTSVCAYIIWKLRIPASKALQLVRSARPCARPNVGFAAALKKWEAKILALDPLPPSTSLPAASVAAMAEVAAPSVTSPATAVDLSSLSPSKCASSMAPTASVTLPVE